MIEITNSFPNKDLWNKLVINNTSPSSFLQSWEWGEFNEKILGLPIARWALLDEGRLRLCFTLIRKKLSWKKYYYYCPRGLIYDQSYAEKRAIAYKILLHKLKFQKDIVFYRSTPPYEYKKYMVAFLKRIGFARPLFLKRQKEPDYTSILDLNQSLDALLKSMHHKTRYNIRLAKKKGVKIRISTSETLSHDIEIFFQLLRQTAQRDKIKIYPYQYYHDLITYFYSSKNELQLKLYLAEFHDTPLSAIIVVYFGNGATYLHGASNDQQRHLMSNYLIQWRAIEDAKNSGYQVYDFWGINDHDQRWRGITNFKKNFGGRTINYIGTFDYIVKKKTYYILAAGKFIKKLIDIKSYFSFKK